MKLHSPSMSELHAFMATVRTGSFTKAADSLCLTQGAVSRAVARLESHFGQALLQRGAQGLRLTAAGQRLMDAASEPLLAIEAISAELRGAAARDTLSLSAVPTLASVWLIPRLPDFHRLHPGIVLNFSAYRRDEDFRGPTPHAAILSGVPGQWPGWQADYIVGREIVVVCHPARLQARRAAGLWKSPTELCQEPLLYHANAAGNWGDWFMAQGIDARPPPGPMMDQVSIILRAVMADMGVAVLQRCLVQEEIAAGAVAVPFEAEVQLQRGYMLCCPESRRQHPAYMAFRDWLLASAQACPQTGDAVVCP